MGFFDKITSAAQSVTNSMTKGAANVGSTAAVVTKEQAELVSLRSEINVIEQELSAAYVQIGRKYVEYVVANGDMPGIDVADILHLIDPKLTKKAEIEKRIIELEKENRQMDVIRAKAAAEDAFLAEKQKLDKALGMELLTKEEYEMKLAVARRRVEHFEEIRRIVQQAEMGLITPEERTAKIQALLNP